MELVIQGLSNIGLLGHLMTGAQTYPTKEEEKALAVQ